MISKKKLNNDKILCLVHHGILAPSLQHQVLSACPGKQNFKTDRINCLHMYLGYLDVVRNLAACCLCPGLFRKYENRFDLKFLNNCHSWSLLKVCRVLHKHTYSHIHAILSLYHQTQWHTHIYCYLLSSLDIDIFFPRYKALRPMTVTNKIYDDKYEAWQDFQITQFLWRAT